MIALLVARPLFPSESANSGDGLTVVTLWLALAVLTLCVALRQRQFILRFSAVDVVVLVLFAWLVIASLWAAQYRSPRPSLNAMWEWIGLGVGYFVARQLIETEREARAVMAMMIALAVGISTYGLYQAWWEMPQSRSVFTADPEGAMRAAGVWFPSGSAERKHFEDRLQNSEPLGTFALTNSLAAFLTPWLILLLAIMASVRSNRKRLVAAAICSIPVVTCFLATKSRSGYLAAGMGTLLVWWLTGKGKPRVGRKLVIAGIALVLAAGAVAAVLEGPGVFRRATKSLGYRLQYWQSSASMIADDPWLGSGPGNFQEAYTAYKLPDASEEISDPHNFLVEIWTNAGTPAALAFLALLALFFSNAVRTAVPCQPGLPAPDTQNVPVVVSASPWPDGSDSLRHVIFGGFAGFLLSLPLGALSTAPPSVAAVIIGLPVAVVAFALLLGWVREGSIPPWMPALGVAVLLVDLLATGGIAFPGVAGGLWLLLALGLRNQEKQAWRKSAGVLLTMVAGSLLIACYQTAYRPVVTCQSHLLQAERYLAGNDGNQLRESLKQLQAAAAADPLCADPWRLMADLRFRRWTSEPSDTNLAEFQSATERVTKIAPFSVVDWTLAGTRYLVIAATVSPDQKSVSQAAAKAVSCLERAVELYPNSAVHRAKLAEAYLRMEDRVSFRREAEKALSLDRVTPHAEKKLPGELRELLLRELSTE